MKTLLVIVLLLGCLTPLCAFAQNAPATRSQIRTIDDVQLYPSEEARQKVKSYTHGNYAIGVFNTFYFILLMAIFAFTGLSARLRAFCERLTAKRFLVIFYYWFFFLLLISVFTFPFDFYKEFLREHHYGFSNQTLNGWLGDYGKAILIMLILGGLFFELLYWIFKRSPARWWILGCIIAIFFMILTVAIAPELIAPLFNKYEPIKNQVLRQHVLDLAHSHGIQPENVYQVDASRQSNKIGAFVTGILGSQRIVLTDTLIQRCSIPEILVVVGHEMGHYLLNHIWKAVAVFAAVIFLFAWLFQMIFRKLTTRHSGKLGFKDIRDIASLPLILLVFSVLFFVFGPVLNTYSRYQEAEADWYGLTSTGYWQSEIEVDKKLGEYREMDPSPLIEFLFFDHPSGKNRIEMALKYRDMYAGK